MKTKPQAGGFCPSCGFDNEEYARDPRHLSPLTPLNGKYLLGRALGMGGFGITYIALDMHLQVVVAIKELYLKKISIRNATKTIDVLSSDKECFLENKKRFLQEARVLAKFNEEDSEGIVVVKDHFEENNTAYIVMEYLSGSTLQKKVKERRLSYEETKTVMEPVCRSLKKIHKYDVMHLDVSPDNIMITQNKGAKLLDFGGAKNISEDESDVIAYKKGYSPVEQREKDGNIGAWTDVYAVAATIYYCLTGKKPTDVMERRIGAELERPSKLGVRLPKSAEDALMKAMELKISDRYQTIDEFWEAYSTTAKSKKKIGGIFALVALAVAMILIVVATKVIIPARETAREYETAFELLSDGSYLESYDVFLKLGDYKDSVAEAEKIKTDHPLYFKEVGDEIVFGTYPQTAEGRRADIEWIILHIDRENHHIMLLSKYALERKVFHDINENISWADSTLRFWLNNEFIDEAFSGSEQKALLTHSTEARDNWEFGTPGGVETDNKVYLLDLKNFDDLLTDKQEIAQCMPTEYAIKQGAEVNGDYCNWWLRSPGEFQNYAAIVDTNGGFINSGRGVTNDTICVRPVIWIDISVLDKN